MRTSSFYSLVFALLSSISLTANAAPGNATEVVSPPLVRDVATTKAQTGKVDLNSADAPTLQRELAGVGEAKAKAIVAYRESNGAFASVDELLEVKGIGKAIVDGNRDRIEVN